MKNKNNENYNSGTVKYYNNDKQNWAKSSLCGWFESYLEKGHCKYLVCSKNSNLKQNDRNKNQIKIIQ